MLISSYYSWQFIFYLNHFWTWKWCHDDTETSFDFTSVDFYLFLYKNNMPWKNSVLVEIQKEKIVLKEILVCV